MKKILNPEEKKDQTASYNSQVEDFTEDDLVDYWMKYAYSIKNADLDFFTTLTKFKPELQEDHQVKLVIFNNTQEADIQKHKPEILKYLRKQLKNYKIDIMTHIDKTLEDKGAYTPQDRYKKLAEKNPSLDALRKKFDMDLGF